MVSVAVITVICFIGMIAASPYGIFLAKDNGGESITDVVKELTDDYYGQIESIKNVVDHDDCEIISNDGVYSLRWDEILSVYFSSAFEFFITFDFTSIESPIFAVNDEKTIFSILST